MDCRTIVYGLYLETKMNSNNIPFTSYLTVIIHCMFLYFTDNLPKRIENINNYFTFSLYSNVCRSLFEKDKLMFAFLLCTRIQAHQGLIMPVSKTQTFKNYSNGLKLIKRPIALPMLEFSSHLQCSHNS